MTTRGVPASLCETCVACRLVRTARSRFILCERSQTELGYVKYPMQPRLSCAGYAPRATPADSANAADPSSE